jgi:dienelactone hydrolase
MGTFFKSADFEFGALEALGASYHRGADVGEVLATVGKVKDGDHEGWYQSWYDTADRVRNQAQQSADAGRDTSARWAFLRASTYFERASFFLDGTPDPSRLVPTWEEHRRCFDEAAARFDPPFEKVEIPYEGTSLPGYLLKADDSGRPRPLLILNNGSDSPASNMYMMGGAAALERRYNALIFDGPGQGAALYRQGLHFRPDWEKVITPVVDFLLGRPEVDPERIAIQGISQGGYWVPRAVAFERRIAAAIADPGVYDVSTTVTGQLPKPMRDLLDRGEREKFDRDTAWAERFFKSLRFTMKFRMRPYGTDSPYEFFKTAEGYNLDGVAEKIRCPMLVTDPENEQFWPGQSKRLYEALTCPKDLVPFTAAEGADSHCEPKALGLRDQRIFDWLDEVLGARAAR